MGATLRRRRRLVVDNEFRRTFLDAKRRYNDSLVDMILAGLKKIEDYVKSKIIKNLERAAAFFKKAASGDMKSFKAGEKEIISSERLIKVCIKLSEGLLKIAQKLSK